MTSQLFASQTDTNKAQQYASASQYAGVRAVTDRNKFTQHTEMTACSFSWQLITCVFRPRRFKQSLLRDRHLITALGLVTCLRIEYERLHCPEVNELLISNPRARR